MVKIYKQPFAHDGDADVIPDASQPDGKLSSTDGWTPDYQLPKTDPNYKPVGRQEMNGVFKEVTEALGQMQVQGAASWSADGAPYPINAQVYHNGKQWLALRADSVEPAEGEDWTEFSAVVINDKLDKSAVVQSTGASTTDIMSQKAVSDQLLGVGQTWQAVTRVLGTNYTNTTGRSIVLSASLSMAAGTSLTIVIDGLTTSAVSNAAVGVASLCVTNVIPNGAVYSITGTGSLTARELR